jgi:hypothetical protein
MSSFTSSKLWPFETRVAILTAPVILILLLVLVAILRSLVGWPRQQLDALVLTGIALLSVVPVLLAVADVLIQRGTIIKYGSLSVDLSGAAGLGHTAVSVPTNIGVEGHPITQSDINQILDSLRKASGTDIVVIDLRDANVVGDQATGPRSGSRSPGQASSRCVCREGLE